jgi:hypothetical protein
MQLELWSAKPYNASIQDILSKVRSLIQYKMREDNNYALSAALSKIERHIK